MPISPNISELTTSELVKHKVNLVPAAALRSYEEVNPRRVADIARSLTDTAFLSCPIIADTKLELIVDGHHRSAALSWLGIDQIPCFGVTYHSSDVEVRGWARSTDASPAQILSAFDQLRNVSDGFWKVVATDTYGEEIAHRNFDSAFDAAHWLERMALYLSSGGYGVSFIPQPPAGEAAMGSTGGSLLQVSPFPEKREVLSAAISGQLYPQQVNRHLVRKRPLALDIPLSVMSSQSSFNTFIETRATNAPVHTAEKVVYEDRFFEETVQIYGAYP